MTTLSKKSPRKHVENKTTIQVLRDLNETEDEAPLVPRKGKGHTQPTLVV